MIREQLMYTLIGICSILIVFSIITNSMSKLKRYVLCLMSFFAIILMIGYHLAYIYNGIPGQSACIITRASKFMVYILFPAIIYSYNQYLRDLIINDGKVENVSNKLRIVEFIVYIEILVVIISQFTGIYYYYNGNNFYYRGKFYFVSYIFPLIALLTQLHIIVDYVKIAKKHFVLIIFTAMPMIGAILQFFVHGVSITSIFVVSMIILLYCYSILDTNRLVEEAHKKEVEFLLQREKDVKTMVSQTTSALVEAIDAKDKYTNGHSKRVAELSVLIAKKSGKDEAELDDIYLTALLHDIGKIGIPNAIINKEGKLTDEEFSIIKTHPLIGREILSKISISPNLIIGASYHHERYDGKGYPYGLKGEEIPEIARIIAVADSFDAMASKRSYRDVLAKDIIINEIKKGLGNQFDPKYGEIMISILEKNEQSDYYFGRASD